MNTTGRWAPILVVVAAVVAGIHAIDPSPVGVFYDDAHYVILGRALAFGDGYRYLNVPGAPVGTHFPPGYPALLAVLWRVSPDFPENVALFKMANAFLLGAVALSVYWMARRLLEITTLGAAFAALASTLAVPALLLSSSVISEVFFLALLLPTLVVAERVPERGGIREAALLGFAAGALCLVRSHAVALLPAIAIGYAVQKRFRAAAVFGGIALLALVPWILWVQRFDPLMPAPLRGQYGSYGAWLADGLRADGTGVLLMAARENVVTTWAIIARSFSLANRPLLDVLAVTGVCVLCAAGALVFARRARIALLFLAFYLAIVLAWPFSPLRFIWGVWPLLVLLMVSGAIRLWRVDRAPRVRNAGRAVSVAMGTIVLVGALLFNVRGYANSWWATVSRSFAPRIQAQLSWVAERTHPDDVVASSDEGAIYLYTGRRALPAASFTVDQFFRQRSVDENARGLLEILQTFAPLYVIAWSRPVLDAATVLTRAQPSALVAHDTIPGGRVFRSRGTP